MTENDIKAELSYAYLHAIASRAGFACNVTGRLVDGAGVDAVLQCDRRLAVNSQFSRFVVEIQLKATSETPILKDGIYSFWLKLDQYDKLRVGDVAETRLLVVLFLPEDSATWLVHSEKELLLRRCAYWVSLRGAPASPNKTGQTVYLPQANTFSVEALQTLMIRISCGEKLNYGV